MVVKSANRTEIVTVRPHTPAARIRAAEALESMFRVVVTVDGGALRPQAGDAARHGRLIGGATAGGDDGDANFRCLQNAHAFKSGGRA